MLNAETWEENVFPIIHKRHRKAVAELNATAVRKAQPKACEAKKRPYTTTDKVLLVALIIEVALMYVLPFFMQG